MSMRFCITLRSPLVLPALQTEAYTAPGQYMMGPDLIVAPAASPVSVITGLLDVSVWLPEGTAWVDFRNASSPIVEGGSANIVMGYSIDDTPVWVRAGAVIPLLPSSLAPVLGISAQQYAALEFQVYPGSDVGGCSV